MGSPTVAAFFRVDGAGEGIRYPGVGRLGVDSSKPEMQNIYWRAATVFYGSSLRANPDARHVLFTNAEPPVVDGHDLAEVFRRFDVDLVDVPFTYRPPTDYYGAWQSQFYYFDLIQFLAGRDEPTSCAIFDLDCLFARSGQPLFDAIESTGLLSYIVEDIEADPDYSNSGLNMHELQAVADEIAGRKLPRVRYCGGEVFGLSQETAASLSGVLPAVWATCLERNAKGLAKLNTEEHFFSYLCAAMELPVGTANGLVRRVWTRRKYRSVSVGDLELVVWHLPAEKKYGLKSLFAEVVNPGAPFWQLPYDDDFARYLAVRVGIPRPTARKKLADGMAAVRERLTT